MADFLRVYAKTGKEYVYSVNKTTGEYVDQKQYKFKWIIQDNDNEKYGSIIGSNSNEFVQVIWREPVPDENPILDRYLICQVEKIDENQNIIGCFEILKIKVSLQIESNNLSLEYLDGAFGGEIVNNTTGEYKLNNQCHLLSNILSFKVKGNENTKFIRISFENSAGQNFIDNSNIPLGYFMESANQDSNIKTGGTNGFYEFDVSNSNGEATFYIKFLHKAFNDGFYWIRGVAIDNYKRYSTPLFLKIKLLNDKFSIENPLIYKEEVTLNDGDVSFDWRLIYTQSIPSWFNIKTYYKIGYINCTSCDPLNDSSFTGDNWGSENDGVLIDDIPVSNLSGPDYIIHQDFTLPDYFIPSYNWKYGDPSIFRVKSFAEIYDSENLICSSIGSSAAIDIKLKYCLPGPIVDSYSFNSPKCPEAPSINSNYSFKPQVKVICGLEKSWNGLTCAWVIGATGPCPTGSGMIWNGSTCACPTGYHLENGVCEQDITQIDCYDTFNKINSSANCYKIYCLQAKIIDSYINCVKTPIRFYSTTVNNFTYEYATTIREGITYNFIKYTHNNSPTIVSNDDVVYYDYNKLKFYNYKNNMLGSTFQGYSGTIYDVNAGWWNPADINVL